MANTLTNFLIGIGFETKDFDKGEKKVNSGLGSIKSRAAIAGAALAGVGIALGAGAINAGNRIDKIALASAKLNTSASFVNNYGNALRLLGGDAAESLQAIESAESALTQFRLKGSFGAFEDPTLAGIDTNALAQAKNGEEFLRQLSAQIPKLNKDQQRLIQDNFGFSDATMASLRLGQKEFDNTIQKAGSLAPITDELIEKARAYNVEMAKTQLIFEGIGNTLADKFLDPITGVISAFNLSLSAGGSLNKDEKTTAKSAISGALSYLPGVSSVIRLKENAPSALKIIGAANKDKYSIHEKYKPNIFNKEFIKDELAQKRANFEKTGQFKTDQQIRDNERSPALSKGWRNSRMFVDRGISAESVRMNAERNADSATNLSEKSATKQPPIQNNINMKVELDGQAFDARVTQVQTRRDFNTIDDIRSTTAR
jgi:hypothetical protein